MNRRKIFSNMQKSTFLRLPDVQARYQVGRATARKLSDEAGATVKVGRVVLVDVARLDAYLETLRDDNVTAGSGSCGK